ncbi:purine-cytosine permease family protein [Streptacidiphilus fuscans]|uniref:Cytosine permease n=1 Tax=Streptacidiphilus fuscans TaxID=2789292 RepID=A0A931BDH1_9ACTN|nr:cytosine permease [Streptacidiphilus fuscans]MBF9071445.1 cytosine permease [Streptacidiphilus fuscans]
MPVSTARTTDTTAQPGARSGRIEARSIDYVPLAERHGKVWHLFPVWFAGDAHLATVATGAIGVALGGNLIWTAIAVVTGCAFGTFFMAFHSTQGPQLGLPQMVQSRPQFGFMGALLVWIVALTTYIGYTAFNQVLVGSTMQHLVSLPTGVSYVGYAVVGILLAIVGYDFIHRASRWLTYLMLAALVVFSVGILAVNPFTHGQLDLGAFSLTPFLIQFFTAAVYQLSWSIYVSDYSRYLPPNVGVRSSFWWTYLGAGVGGAWMMLVGTVAAGLFPKADLVNSVISAGNELFPGFGVTLLVASVVPLLTIGTLNFYGASLTMLSSLDSIKQVKPTVAKRIATLVLVGVVSTAIAFGSDDSFLTQFGEFLTVLGYLFTPWTAINLVDFYVIRRGHYSIREIFNPRGIYGRWSWRGLVAYGVGFAAMIPFAVVGTHMGPVAQALNGTDVSMPIGLIVAAGLYVLLCRSLDLTAERAAVTAADRGLDADPVMDAGADMDADAGPA